MGGLFFSFIQKRPNDSAASLTLGRPFACLSSLVELASLGATASLASLGLSPLLSAESRCPGSRLVQRDGLREGLSPLVSAERGMVLLSTLERTHEHGL
jgi:hypothetical protein